MCIINSCRYTFATSSNCGKTLKHLIPPIEGNLLYGTPGKLGKMRTHCVRSRAALDLLHRSSLALLSIMVKFAGHGKNSNDTTMGNPQPSSVKLLKFRLFQEKGPEILGFQNAVQRLNVGGLLQI